MSKKRYINTKFWSDSFVVGLNPLDRYLFLYFLSNEHTDICGIYELPLNVICRETGLEKEMIITMLHTLSGKVYLIDGWVYIKNFSKHQAINDSIQKGIERSLKEVPDKIIEKIKEIDGGSYTGIYTSKPNQQYLDTVPNGIRKKILQRDKVCQKCLKADDLQIHHIIPRWQGGTHDEKNLLVLCKNCHIEHHKMTGSDRLGQTGSDSDLPKLKLRLKPKTSAKAEKQLTDIQEVVNYFFELKGWSLEDIKANKIIYSRFVKPAKQLLEICNLEEAKEKLKIIKNWADSQDIDWGIETVFKRWHDLGILPQEKTKKTKIEGLPAYFRLGEWYVIQPNGEHKRWVGSKNKIISE